MLYEKLNCQCIPNFHGEQVNPQWKIKYIYNINHLMLIMRQFEGNLIMETTTNYLMQNCLNSLHTIICNALIKWPYFSIASFCPWETYNIS